MNKLDTTLHAVCPTIMVPCYEDLEPLTESGHRFLAAKDGLHVELHRPWLHMVFPVAESVIPLPYGGIAPVTNLCFNPRQLSSELNRFIEEARRACPKEHAAWLSFDSGKGLRYEETTVLSSGDGHIRYKRPSLTGTRTLAVDLHSHGRHPAMWSSVDDIDDVDDAKLAVVVGNLDKKHPSIAARLLALNASIDMSAWVASFCNTGNN